MLLIALSLTAVDPPPRPMEALVVRDAITDEVRAFATLRDGPNRLVVSCDPARYRGTRVSFHANRWLERGNVFTGERPLVYRFDENRPRRTMWDVEDRRGTLAGRERVDPFLQELMASERLVIRARDIEHRRFDIVFRLRDVRPAVEHALAACAAGTAAS